MKILELFCGYGTASHALKQLEIDFEIIGYSDIDKYANQCFRKNHWQNMPKTLKQFDNEYSHELGDVTKIDPNDLEDFDLLTGGFPCQAFSIAGKGLGELDTRGTLFNEIIRIAAVKKPRYMMLENVKGLMSKRHKPTFDKIISELYRIGYFVKWKILNTKDYGIPQNRERVFFICFKSWTDFCDYKWPQKEELKIFLKDVLEEEVDEKYYLSSQSIKRLVNNHSGYHSKINPEIGSCLFASMHKIARGMDLIEPRIYDAYNKKIKTDGTCPTLSDPCHNNIRLLEIKNATKKGYIEGYDGDGISLEHPDSKTRRGRVQDQISPTLQCNDARGVITNSMRWQRTEKGKALRRESMAQGKDNTPFGEGCREIKPATDGISNTITTAISKDYLIGNNLTIRKLTPIECFRLQGFLNDEVILDGLSNTQRYKLAGNGQSVNVVKKIFENLFATSFLNKESSE